MPEAASARARAHTVAAPAPRPRPEVASRRPARPRTVTGGIVWIALVAVLLSGIVALNVAAVRLNVQAQRLEERKERLRGENAVAAAELSRLAAAARIEAVARGTLALVPPIETTYVEPRRARR